MVSYFLISLWDTKEDQFDEDNDGLLEFEQEFNQAAAHEPNGTPAAGDTGVQLSIEASKKAEVKLNDDLFDEAEDNLDAEEEAAEALGAYLATGGAGPHNYKGVYAGRAGLTKEDEYDSDDFLIDDNNSDDIINSNEAGSTPPKARENIKVDACSAESARGPREEVEEKKT